MAEWCPNASLELFLGDRLTDHIIQHDQKNARVLKIDT